MNVIRGLKKDYGSEAGVIEYWAGSPVSEVVEGGGAEVIPEPTPVVERAVEEVKTVKEEVPEPVVAYPHIGMGYKEYMACLPKKWRVAEGPGTKTVYDNYGQCQRIFKLGRDF